MTEMQVFNPAFVRKVWEARRRLAVREQIPAAPRPPRPSRRDRELREAVRNVKLGSADRSVSEIIASVAARHRIPVAAIVGRKKFDWLVAVRREAMVAVATERPDLSLSQISRAFNRDHTTIVHALQKAGIPSRSLDLRKAAMARGVTTPDKAGWGYK